MPPTNNYYHFILQVESEYVTVGLFPDCKEECRVKQEEIGRLPNKAEKMEGLKKPPLRWPSYWYVKKTLF